MNATHTDPGHGLADPVHHGQAVFRAVLDAMARPGTVHTLADAVLSGLKLQGAGGALNALLLTLLDADTRAHLLPPLATNAVRAHLSFYTGAALTPDLAQADFLVGTAASADPALFGRLQHGSDAQPQDGATWLIEVDSFTQGPLLTLAGPGIASTHTVRAAGLGTAFWAARPRPELQFPLGIDLIFTCGAQLWALPRSTRVTLED